MPNLIDASLGRTDGAAVARGKGVIPPSRDSKSAPVRQRWLWEWAGKLENTNCKLVKTSGVIITKLAKLALNNKIMLFALVIVWEEPSLICPPPLLIKTELEVWQFFEDTCTPRHRPFLVIGELGDRWAGGLVGCAVLSRQQLRPEDLCLLQIPTPSKLF